MWKLLKSLGQQGQRQRKKRTPVIFGLLILLWSLGLGWGGAWALNTSFSPLTSSGKSVDYVPEKYQLGQQIYVESCGSCHLALSPAVFPSETWRQLLQQPEEHYGVSLAAIIKPKVLLMWDYLRFFSRPLYEGEEVPYRLEESRYFKALHPKVDLPERLTPNSCVSCHARATEFNFRDLTDEWEEE